MRAGLELKGPAGKIWLSGKEPRGILGMARIKVCTQESINLSRKVWPELPPPLHHWPGGRSIQARTRPLRDSGVSILRPWREEGRTGPVRLENPVYIAH